MTGTILLTKTFFRGIIIDKEALSMLQRTEYLKKLDLWREKKVIKVITGIRRCGKSTLLRQYAEFLKKNGTAEKQIVFLNFEEMENERLLDPGELYAYITERFCGESPLYIFLDEVQKVRDFEKVVDSLFVKENTDIYITGSNSYLLSGELATYLSGRYIEIPMLPFSFSEYAALHDTGETDKIFMSYVRSGGFPYLASLKDAGDEIADTYLEGIYNTVLVKDIEERSERRNDGIRAIKDVTMLKNISRYLASNIGSAVSGRSITGVIVSSGIKVSQNTVLSYIDALKESFVFYPCERFDVTGKQLLETNGKMYIVDSGLRRFIVPKRSYDIGHVLENIVFLELKRRGYSVYVGKLQKLEVDFVTEKGGEYSYWQVTASMLEESVFEREMAPLAAINDNYPKTVLTLDRFSDGNYNGIQVVNVIDWLLG